MKQAYPPDFGPLAGVRVISCGSALAGPFAAQLMAEWGADVIWVESPKVPDVMRSGPEGVWVEGERRNQRNIALDMSSAAGQAVFLKLIESAAILVENSRGGHFDRLGLPDERLWRVNPRLVVAHISGFGQSGVAEVVGRPCYDAVAQAFGCYMQLTGRPGDPPAPAIGFPGDYYAGLFATSACLAALIRARATGEGESIDIAMFEALLRAQGYGHLEYLNLGKAPLRRPEGPIQAVGMGAYECADGVSVYMVMVGVGVLRRALVAMDVQDAAEYLTGQPYIERTSAAGERLEAMVEAFCAGHKAQEVERILTAHDVPCSRIYDYAKAQSDPHYRARESFIEWQSVSGASIKGVKVVPDFDRRPGRVWRGGATRGMDNEIILREAGFSAEEIQALYAEKVIFQEAG